MVEPAWKPFLGLFGSKRLKSATVGSTRGRVMAHVIVADANEGRRSLLANTLEREGFQVTRVSNLRQAVGTAVATTPEVLLLEETWPQGDALEAAQSVVSNPAVGARTRVLLLSRETSQEAMIGAAGSGIAEVLSKPIDMSRLIARDKIDDIFQHGIWSRFASCIESRER